MRKRAIFMNAKDNSSVVVKSITLKLGKQEITLTVEDAHKLQAELNEVFGQTVPLPFWQHTQIVYVDRYVPQQIPAPWAWPTIMCQGFSGHSANQGIGLGNTQFQST
jgi:hypothetical protein